MDGISNGIGCLGGVEEIIKLKLKFLPELRARGVCAFEKMMLGFIGGVTGRALG